MKYTFDELTDSEVDYSDINDNNKYYIVTCKSKNYHRYIIPEEIYDDEIKMIKKDGWKLKFIFKI